MKALALLTSAAVLALAATIPASSFADDSAAAAPAAAAQDIVRRGDDLPGPLAVRGPQLVRINLTTTEVTGQLADGATYRYWTYNAKVPGPFVRVRVGDTVEVTLNNAADSMMMHNVDLHAVTGPGGGAAASSAQPGETKTFTFKALKPGLYVYHCATPMVAQHIANGMYGLILVEPAEPLPAVDHEFYVMQGELYTEEDMGSQGELTESIEHLLDERPSYYVMNGAFKALTGDRRMKVKVGETVRIYFGVGGPNKGSSFHVIGEIFDRVYDLGSLGRGVTNDVQTVSVAPGGAVAVDIKFEVPGTYFLVDHALSRVDRGAAAAIEVTGADAPEIYHAAPGTPTDMAH
jgi:nitrite reductase (NO-forming)